MKFPKYSTIIKNRFLDEFIVTGSKPSDGRSETLKSHRSGGKKMVSIKEHAKEYKIPETLNVVALEKVSVDQEIRERIGKTEDGKEFSYFFVEIDEVQYRVPVSVIKQLKGLVEEKPHMTHFKVKKSGEGMNTQYQVFEV